MKAYAFLESSSSSIRFMLGDHYGSLQLLLLHISDGKVTEITTENYGTVSSPTCLVHLSPDLLFVGSHFGDSQLLRLRTEPFPSSDDMESENTETESRQLFDLVDTYANIAPVLDFTVVDLDGRGQGTVVACCGGFKDGSIRVVRNGVGVVEIAGLEVEGVKGIWGLKNSYQAKFHSLLALSFTAETRFLLVDSTGEMAEHEPAALSGQVPTLLVANMAADSIVQVTSEGVYLVDNELAMLLAEWKPENGRSITVASCGATQLAFALAGGEVVYLEVPEGRTFLSVVARHQFEHEVSCLDVSPPPGRLKSDYVVV
ncbi:DNA damage-binding protein 1a, partial [Gonapodya sp. JEL0774]